MNQRQPIEIIDEQSLIDALRTTPMHHLPRERTNAILESARTSRVSTSSGLRFPTLLPRLAAALVVLAAGAAIFIALRPTGPSHEQAMRAADQIRYVLVRTSGVMQRAESEALAPAMSRGLAPVVEHTPLPDVTPHEPRSDQP